MKKTLLWMLPLLLFAPIAQAAMNGQILNCDAPNPLQPTSCVDNWALDVLDESKTALETAPGAFPRDRKHYFDGTGAGVHIFLIDTGIDGTNPDFKVLGNAAQNRFGSVYNNFNIIDGDSGSHGTRTAGLAAGLQYGVAKGATIHPIYTAGSIKSTGGADILARLNWVYDEVVNKGARPAVLNMSFNIPRPVTGAGMTEADLTNKVLQLIAQGVVVVVSAGNHNGPNPGNYWPSVIPEVILVGGVDESGNRWVRDASDPDYNAICVGPPGAPLGDCGSNYGSLVDLWAPAKFIRSAVKKNNKDVDAPRIRSGTSFAAPLVSGLAALYLQNNQTATPAQVLNALRANAANLGDIDGNFTADFMVRDAVAVPACNIPQRLFVNAGQSVTFRSIDLTESCPAGYSGQAQFNSVSGQVTIAGVGPEGILYRYTPNVGFTGNDLFTYNILTGSGSLAGANTANVMVQPNHN